MKSSPSPPRNHPSTYDDWGTLYQVYRQGISQGWSTKARHFMYICIGYPSPAISQLEAWGISWSLGFFLMAAEVLFLRQRTNGEDDQLQRCLRHRIKAINIHESHAQKRKGIIVLVQAVKVHVTEVKVLWCFMCLRFKLLFRLFGVKLVWDDLGICISINRETFIGIFHFLGAIGWNQATRTETPHHRPRHGDHWAFRIWHLDTYRKTTWKKLGKIKYTYCPPHPPKIKLFNPQHSIWKFKSPLSTGGSLHYQPPTKKAALLREKSSQKPWDRASRCSTKNGSQLNNHGNVRYPPKSYHLQEIAGLIKGRP